ncbi:MAG TPA: hypothetical protein VG942_02245 [Hyphomonadaceae bacterium]|nr:hypothetical protein [Hyphomonadaceae bacterium]
MKLRLSLIALACTDAAIAQPPTSVQPGDGLSAEQITRTLADPKFCGTPAPDGYVCALLYYEDQKARDALIPKAQIAKAYTRAIVAVTPAKKPGDPADLAVLSPEGCVVHTTAKAAQQVSASDARKKSHRTIVRSIVGYLDNERRPVGDARKIDRSSFLKPATPEGRCR